MRISINRNQPRGFTLIEVIVSLLLLGIVSAGVGFGIFKIADSYIFAKNNSETVGKVQMAMTRIVKELGSTTGVTTALGNSITFNRTTDRSPVSATISLNGSTVQIDGATVIDHISAFTLRYFNAAGVETAVVEDIRRIDISMTFTGANNSSLSFDNSVIIRESYS